MPVPESTWVCVASVTNTLSAATIVARLESEGVPSRVEKGSEILGEAQLCAVVVPFQLEHQAQSVLNDGQFTDDELVFLATGQVCCEDSKE